MKHIDGPESVMIFNSVLVFKVMKLKNAIQKVIEKLNRDLSLRTFKLIEPLMITIVHY